MRTNIIILLSFFSLAAFAQFNVKEIEANQIPSTIKLKKNKVVSTINWQDKAGDNYVIETETPLLMTKTAEEANKNTQLIRTEGKFVNSKKVNGKMVRGQYVGGKTDTLKNMQADYRIKGLFTYHYIVKDTAKTIFKHIDQMTDCPYNNLTANYLGAPTVTDLDNDGIAEVWFVYQTGCREKANVPLEIKIAMYTGNVKHMIFGTQEIHVGEQTLGGEIKPDKSFDNLSQAFKDYAISLWNKYKTEK